MSPFVLERLRPLKYMIFAVGFPLISVTRWVPSATPSRCRSMATSMVGFASMIGRTDASAFSYALLRSSLPLMISYTPVSWIVSTPRSLRS